MIKKNDIKVGFVFKHIAYSMPMTVKSFSPVQESRLGIITLKALRFTWTGSLHDFLYEFTFFH